MLQLYRDLSVLVVHKHNPGLQSINVDADFLAHIILCKVMNILSPSKFGKWNLDNLLKCTKHKISKNVHKKYWNLLLINADVTYQL